MFYVCRTLLVKIIFFQTFQGTFIFRRHVGDREDVIIPLGKKKKKLFVCPFLTDRKITKILGRVFIFIFFYFHL